MNVWPTNLSTGDEDGYGMGYNLRCGRTLPIFTAAMNYFILFLVITLEGLTYLLTPNLINAMKGILFKSKPKYLAKSRY